MIKRGSTNETRDPKSGDLSVAIGFGAGAQELWGNKLRAILPDFRVEFLVLSVPIVSDGFRFCAAIRGAIRAVACLCSEQWQWGECAVVIVSMGGSQFARGEAGPCVPGGAVAADGFRTSEPCSNP
jgi:hypothetical protein